MRFSPRKWIYKLQLREQATLISHLFYIMLDKPSVYQDKEKYIYKSWPHSDNIF